MIVYYKNLGHLQLGLASAQTETLILKNKLASLLYMAPKVVVIK